MSKLLRIIFPFWFKPKCAFCQDKRVHGSYDYCSKDCGRKAKARRDRLNGARGAPGRPRGGGRRGSSGGPNRAGPSTRPPRADLCLNCRAKSKNPPHEYCSRACAKAHKSVPPTVVQPTLVAIAGLPELPGDPPQAFLVPRNYDPYPLGVDVPRGSYPPSPGENRYPDDPPRDHFPERRPTARPTKKSSSNNRGSMYDSSLRPSGSYHAPTLPPTLSPSEADRRPLSRATMRPSLPPPPAYGERRLGPYDEPMESDVI